MFVYAVEKDGFVKVKGLGAFKLVKNEERKSVNVTTGEAIIIPAHNKVSFIPQSEGHSLFPEDQTDSG